MLTTAELLLSQGLVLISCSTFLVKGKNTVLINECTSRYEGPNMLPFPVGDAVGKGNA